MENDLKKRGFKYLTLGVEPCEIRNIQIYFKWGFIKYIKTHYEYYSSSEKVIVNYYEKIGAKYIENLNNGEKLYYIDLEQCCENVVKYL